jgi:uncharacterized protein (DUF58 family)
MRRFLPFLLVLFIIAAVLRVTIIFTIFYLFLALALMTRFWLNQGAERLAVRRRFVNRAHFGDRVNVELMVTNTSWLPVPWLGLHESLPVDLFSPPFTGRVVSLSPRARWRTEYTLVCRKRGYYPIGPLRIDTGDLLGIDHGSTRHVPVEHLMVYPQILPLGQLGLPTRSPLVALPARAPLFEDPARVTGVRDYQRGDSPRRIHWTATASAGRLLVKQYQPAIARETSICLDLDWENYDERQRYNATELSIVVAASVANHIVLREQLPVGLITETHDAALDDQVRYFLPPRSERTHLMRLLEILACAQVAHGTSFPEFLRRESVRLTWGATLLVITGRESAELFDTLLYLRRAGFAVALVLVQPGQASEELRRRAEFLKLPVHRVWREGDLEMWR